MTTYMLSELFSSIVPRSSVPAHWSRTTSKIYVLSYGRLSWRLTRGFWSGKDIETVCRLMSEEGFSYSVTIHRYMTLDVRMTEDTFREGPRHLASPIPLYRNLVEMIRSFPNDEDIILVAFSQGHDNGLHPETIDSVREALAAKPKVLLCYMGETSDAEEIGAAMGAHSVLPYSDAHVVAAFEAVYRSVQVYQRTGTLGVFEQSDKDAAIGRAQARS